MEQFTNHPVRRVEFFVAPHQDRGETEHGHDQSTCLRHELDEVLTEPSCCCQRMSWHEELFIVLYFTSFPVLGCDFIMVGLNGLLAITEEKVVLEHIVSSMNVDSGQNLLLGSQNITLNYVILLNCLLLVVQGWHKICTYLVCFEQKSVVIPIALFQICRFASNA